jgi:hypothetical protein
MKQKKGISMLAVLRATDPKRIAREEQEALEAMQRPTPPLFFHRGDAEPAGEVPPSAQRPPAEVEKTAQKRAWSRTKTAVIAAVAGLSVAAAALGLPWLLGWQKPAAGGEAARAAAAVSTTAGPGATAGTGAGRMPSMQPATSATVMPGATAAPSTTAGPGVMPTATARPVPTAGPSATAGPSTPSGAPTTSRAPSGPARPAADPNDPYSNPMVAPPTSATATADPIAAPAVPVKTQPEDKPVF